MTEPLAWLLAVLSVSWLIMMMLAGVALARITATLRLIELTRAEFAVCRPRQVTLAEAAKGLNLAPGEMVEIEIGRFKVGQPTGTGPSGPE